MEDNTREPNRILQNLHKARTTALWLNLTESNTPYWIPFMEPPLHECKNWLAESCNLVSLGNEFILSKTFVVNSNVS